MNVGLYSLVVTNLDTNKGTMIELTDRVENRYKTNLAYIDYLTTCFKNEEILLKRLYDNHYIDFKNASIHIEYQQNGYIHKLPVLYEDAIDFRKLIDKNSSNIDLNNEYFIHGVDNFILELNNEDFRKYVLNSKLNNYVKEKIINFYETRDINEIGFNKQKLLEAFSPYKTFRDFTFLVEKYKNRQQNQIIHDIEEEPERLHESDDEFLTEEDWTKYGSR